MITGIRVEPKFDPEQKHSRWNTLQFFLEVWLDEVCSDDFRLEKEKEEYHILFNSPEDATYVRLCSLPTDLDEHMSLHETKRIPSTAFH